MESLCLDGVRSRGRLVERVEAAGFATDGVREHRDDLLTMRDDLADRLDYEALLSAPGRTDLLAAVRELERAVEDGRVGYVSLVAHTA